MSKTVKEVLEKIKGTGNETKTMTGKGSFSSSNFADFVHAMANDGSFKVKSVGKDGKETETCVKDLLVADAKRTLADAKYPQKSEAGTLDTSEIATTGLSKAITPIITEWLRTGRKLPIAPQKDFVGDVYLASLPGRTKTVNVRDIKTGANIGTTTITSKDSVQVRVKSPVPAHLLTKVRKDASGQVVKA